MSQLHCLSLAAMADRVRRREVTPSELVQAHLDRIAGPGAALNAFVEVYGESALAAARSAPGGPLPGVPVTIKDSFDIEGRPTLCGSKLRVGHRADADATAVARLRAAGAVILGKTNTPEMLSHYESDNFITGCSNNPWNLDRTPGGSSGGEAAAIAAFCSAGGIGSDGGGSIRVPAHFCGIAALKPTPGRVPATGHFPLIQHPGGLLGVAGPMARSVSDVKLLFEVLAGYDPADPFSAPVQPSPAFASGLRVGVLERFNNVPVHPDIASAVHTAAKLLGDLGFHVEPFHPAGLERAPNLWAFFFSGLAVPFTREMIAGREQDVHWTATEFYERLKDQPEPTGREVVDNLAARDRMRAHVLEQMRDIPVILSPVCAMPAFKHRQRRFPVESGTIGLFQAMMPVTWPNLLGLPALAVPLTIGSEGMPIGVQLIGRPWEEELLLETGIRLEEARGALPVPPL